MAEKHHSFQSSKARNETDSNLMVWDLRSFMPEWIPPPSSSSPLKKHFPKMKEERISSNFHRPINNYKFPSNCDTKDLFSVGLRHDEANIF